MLVIRVLTGLIAVYAIFMMIQKKGEKKGKKNAGEDDNISKIAEKMGKSMQKGFLSSLVLIVLKKEPAHGYKLIQEITDRTDERWVPTAASIYPLLKSFAEKGLIRIVEPGELGELEKETERPTKTYAITPRGEQLIHMLGDKQRDLVKSIMTFMLTSREDLEDLKLGSRRDSIDLFSGKFPPEKIFNRMDEDMAFFLENIPNEKQVPMLNTFKQTLTKILQKIEKNLQQIENEKNK